MNVKYHVQLLNSSSAEMFRTFPRNLYRGRERFYVAHSEVTFLKKLQLSLALLFFTGILVSYIAFIMTLSTVKFHIIGHQLYNLFGAGRLGRYVAETACERKDFIYIFSA